MLTFHNLFVTRVSLACQVVFSSIQYFILCVIAICDEWLFFIRRDGNCYWQLLLSSHENSSKILQ